MRAADGLMTLVSHCQTMADSLAALGYDGPKITDGLSAILYNPVYMTGMKSLLGVRGTTTNLTCLLEIAFIASFSERKASQVLHQNTAVQRHA